MATVSKPKIITAEALVALGEDANVEVVKGELIEMSPAGARHGEIGGNIFAPLWTHVKSNSLGKVFMDQTTYVLQGTPDDIQTIRVPDISFIAAANLPDQTPKGYWYQPPDVAVEIISSSDKAGDIQARIADYLEAGTREVWVAYPELAQIMVHQKDSSRLLHEEDTLTGEELLPGFALKLIDVFN